MINMNGFKNSLIEVISYNSKNRFRKHLWNCICKCGKEIIRSTDQIRRSHPKSCGCYIQARRGNNKRHDYHTKHGMANKHPLYKTWKNIKQRCYNQNNKSYMCYGGKGISVCEEWINDSGAFLKWGLSHGWEKGISIDRIDSNKDYSPDNCQFLNRADNSRKVFIENPTLHRGSNHKDASINESTVRLMRIDFNHGLRQADIMKKYNISRNMAYQIANYKTWKHVSI